MFRISALLIVLLSASTLFACGGVPVPVPGDGDVGFSFTAPYVSNQVQLVQAYSQPQAFVSNYQAFSLPVAAYSYPVQRFRSFSSYPAFGFRQGFSHHHRNGLALNVGHGWGSNRLNLNVGNHQNVRVFRGPFGGLNVRVHR